VTLFWQTQVAPSVDYALTLWLVNQSGQEAMRADVEPLGGEYPTSRWGAGQWVRDRFDLVMPRDLPRGLYQVFADWRDPLAGSFLSGGTGRIPLGEVFIADQ
jgi:hypothetical protein